MLHWVVSCARLQKSVLHLTQKAGRHPFPRCHFQVWVVWNDNLTLKVSIVAIYFFCPVDLLVARSFLTSSSSLHEDPDMAKVSTAPDNNEPEDWFGQTYPNSSVVSVIKQSKKRPDVRVLQPFISLHSWERGQPQRGKKASLLLCVSTRVFKPLLSRKKVDSQEKLLWQRS